jgi:hypothetical protein
MEPALRAALVRSVMAEASGQARYALATEGGALVASHPSQDLRARFDAEALTLSDRSGGQPVRLSLSRVNGQPAGRASVRADGNRVELSRGALTEWWVHGALGLEQGFTLARAPAGSAGEVVLELAVEAPGYVPEERSGSLALVRGSREVRVRDLYAEDAAGRALPAQMAWRAGGLELRVVTAGARYPVVIDPTWSEQQKLTASDEAWNDDFGTSVALSGDTAVVGAPFDDDAGSASGSAYVFVRSGTRWSQQQKLTASDAAPNDDFGLAVAVSGDTAVVGAIGDDDAGRDSGAAYVFVRSGTRWRQQQKLTASDAASSDLFGNSVAVSGDTAVVGARGDDDAGGVNSGAAYVFVRSGTRWSQQQKLTASDAAPNDDFGLAVALSGDTAVVGAENNSAYVFVRSGTRWSEQQKLTASDAAAGAGGFFGNSVAVSGDTAVVGAYADVDAGGDSGAAYVFVRSGTRWSEQQKLTASDAAAGIRFGNSVAVSGDTAVVGAYADDSAYVFVRPSAVCGNAVVEPGEACDGGACCTSRCAFASSETTCTGTSNGGPCDDTSDRCSGTANTCVDRFLTTMCRRTAGECDAAEVCTGTTGSCPPDAAAAPGSPCGGAPSGACDAQDTCAGSVGATASCQANFLPSSTACRPDVGDCDVEELCTGSDAVCPADVPIPDCAMSDGGASMPDGGASVPDGGATAEDTGALVLDAGPVDASFPGDGADIDPLDAGPRVARSGGCGFRCAVLGVRDRGHRGALALALLAVLGTLARRRRP